MKEVSNTGIADSMVQYPSLLRRIQALLVDSLLILLFFSASSMIISLAGGTATGVRVGIFLFCIVMYEPLLVASRGGTLGHALLRIQIKKYDDPAQTISMVSAIVRILVKGLLGWISFLAVIFSHEKRAIHDIASGAIVLMK